jgi:ACS family tartrate transporter-like MFS transporter
MAKPPPHHDSLVYSDRVIEYSTVRKLLWHLLPLLCLLAMAHTLDRINLSYAGPAMNPALHQTGLQLRTANDWFDLGYLLASLPAAWLMLRAGTRRWIVGIVLTWACIAVAHALVWSTASLYVLRFLLGVAEASLLPAIIFYLGDWFPGRHRTRAIAALIAAASLVPLLGDEVSGILLFMARYFGFTEWRWLFVVEGAPALWLGLTVLTELPDDPGETSWLFAAERHWLQTQLAMGSASRLSARDGLRSTGAWKLAAVAMAAAVVAGNRSVWVALAMQHSLYMPPKAGATAMTVAAVLGAFGAAAAAIRWRNLRQWRLGLAGCLAASGLVLTVAGLVPGGYVAVLMLAVAEILAPTILTLAWALVPAMITGPAVAVALAVVGMGGALGDAAAGLLAASDSTVLRCLVMAALCLIAAWLAFGVEAQPGPAQPAANEPGPALRRPSGA